MLWSTLDLFWRLNIIYINYNILCCLCTRRTLYLQKIIWMGLEFIRIADICIECIQLVSYFIPYLHSCAVSKNNLCIRFGMPKQKNKIIHLFLQYTVATICSKIALISFALAFNFRHAFNCMTKLYKQYSMHNYNIC